VSAHSTGSAACALGGTLLTPTAVRTDSLGVRYYTYRAEPGLFTKVAPSGLTAARVTTALLVDLGLESASSARESLSAQARQRMDGEAIALSRAPAPRICLGNQATRRLLSQPLVKARTARPAPSELPWAHTYSDNWGGYAVTESEFGAGINSVEGAFTVGTSMSDLAKMAESTWVGLGGGLAEGVNSDGDQTYGLLQAGVAMLTDPGSAGPAGFTSWMEDLGGECNVNTDACTSQGCVGSNNYCDPFYNPGDSTRPGDAVLVGSYYSSSSLGCAFIVDYTHSSGSFPTTCMDSAVYDHTSAEWINENWLQYGFPYDYPADLIGFNTQNISAAFGGDSSWVGAFTGAYEGVVMDTDDIDQHGNPYADPPTPGTPSCPANVTLAEGVNASGSSSQIESFWWPGCDE
jgi:Peptidase A4 family